MAKVFALCVALGMLALGFAQDSHKLDILIPTERVLIMNGQLGETFTEPVQVMISAGEVTIEPANSSLVLFANTSQPWYLIASLRALGNAPSGLSWQLASGEAGLLLDNNDSILTSGSNNGGWQDFLVSYDVLGQSLADGIYNFEVSYRLF